MNVTRRGVVLSATAATWLAAVGERAFAQAAPFDTVKVVTGFPPGGTSDTICRRVATKLAPGYGKSVVVENRVGAGGQIAVQSFKTAPPDGSQILQTPMSMLGVYPHIYKKLQYDPATDVVPASLGATFDFGFAVGPAVPASVRNIPEFLDWCKANPNQANFGSPGAGAVPHFIGVLIGRSAGVDLKHVPYRGTQPAILEMIGGQIQAVSGPVGEFIQHVAAGKCRLLATTGAARSKFAPTVPTLLEQGLKDMAFNEWFGFYLPAKSPPEVVQRANAALRAALAEREVIEGLETMGLEAKSSTPAELGAMLKADTERWGPVVKAIGFTADS
ncbi:MAG TPA: Bug family tripartite tricarboxylate transporter substrate binding protein [Burkholderiaceae bacterium]|nr:Bug family tripartite tricarboxylate transporter substrate binding protein [Burkholderiaceae bacterium]